MTTPTHGLPSERRRSHALWRAVLLDRLALKLTALAISVLLWLVVSARRPTESVVEVEVMPMLHGSLVSLAQPPKLQALVTGRAVDLMKLETAPLVMRRTITAPMPDSLVLDVAPSDVYVPPELSDVVRVLDVQPRTLIVRMRGGRRAAMSTRKP
jgi:hypothetical protein